MLNSNSQPLYKNFLKEDIYFVHFSLLLSPFREISFKSYFMTIVLCEAMRISEPMLITPTSEKVVINYGHNFERL